MKLENGKTIVLRQCKTSADSAKATCEAESKGSDSSICETCNTDECNGALQYGPVALMIAIPLAVIKISQF